MKRFVLFAAAQFALGSLWAQPGIVSTRVTAEPCGQFYVDGALYSRVAVFLWPENSEHILSVGRSYYIAEDILCQMVGTPLDGSATCNDAWQKACAPDTPPCAKAPVAPCAVAGTWVDSRGTVVPGGPTVEVTASSAITSYRTDSEITFRVLISLGEPNSAMPFSCDQQGPAYGSLVVNGSCYSSDAILWLPANTAMTVTVYPPPGFVFAGWQGGPLGGLTQFSGSFVLLGPVVLRPLFTPAITVALRTSPDALQLMVDRTVVRSPTSVEWGLNTTHMLSSVSPQRDMSGGLWVWDSWSQGGSETQVVNTNDIAAVGTITAIYAPGTQVSFTSQPVGLKLVIDGRDNWPNYNFAWKIGSTHTISAPLQQADAQGRQYVFNSWSTPGGADQTFTVTGPEAWGAVAKYDILGRLTIQSMPGDINVQVDGVACKTPCVIDRRAGTQVKVSAPTRVSLSDNARLDYSSWSDGGPRERTWTATTDATVLMVNYQSSYLIQAVSDPAGGAAFTFTPASSDGFYPVNTDVTVTATAQPGYKFKYWEAGASGTSPTVQVNTSLPVFLEAVLERVPYVQPTGVRNAAGDGTAPLAVAPGSLISVYGGGLAPGTEKGPDSPLAQTLANVTVQVADRILPLLFVSPSQINAQLPSDLPEGRYKVLVRGDTQPDATALFTARRNAPGLFTRVVNDKQYALATHADGTPLTTDSPAARGETVTLLGTGLGPYKEYPIDGFAVPAGMVLHLADPVEILVGDKILTPSETVAATGYVGITAIRFKITDDLPAATDVELKVRINYYWESNPVLLPLK
ncbi:MAG: hypothetical protein ABSE56_23115 [Bryobacteraceae bacterium]|jgi:uncharacterized protein (TIGR03437 family)